MDINSIGKLTYTGIFNDPLSAVDDNKSIINNVSSQYGIPSSIIGAIIFREQGTNKPPDSIANTLTLATGTEHSVGLGAIFASTARDAWESEGRGNELPESNYDLQKKLSSDNEWIKQREITLMYRLDQWSNGKKLFHIIIRRCECLGNDDKVNPGIIDFTNWTIGSKDAIEKAKSVLSDSEHNSKVYLRAYHNYNSKKEYWRADFATHWVEVDPITGEIIA